MSQSEMEELIKLQKETIESLRQLVENQRLTIEQMAKSHEEQTAQLNQTIANLNETVAYLKRKLFASSSEKTKTDAISGQMDLFNEAEAVADPSVPEPTLEEAVGGYKRQARKARATREEILAGLPVIEVPCTVPDEDRNCPYCNTPMEVIGKKIVREELRIIPAKVERIRYVQEVLGCPECKKDGASVIVGAETPSPLLKHSLASPIYCRVCNVPEICEQHPALPSGSGLETDGGKAREGNTGQLGHQMRPGLHGAGI